MARILSVSRDPALVRTRQMMLEREGHEVVSSLSFKESVEHCRRGGFDLFILGHSLLDSDKRKLVNTFRQHCPAPIISLSRTLYDRRVDGADFHILPEPEQLLTVAADALKGKAAKAEG